MYPHVRLQPIVTEGRWKYTNLIEALLPRRHNPCYVSVQYNTIHVLNFTFKVTVSHYNISVFLYEPALPRASQSKYTCFTKTNANRIHPLGMPSTYASWCKWGLYSVRMRKLQLIMSRNMCACAGCSWLWVGWYILHPHTPYAWADNKECVRIRQFQLMMSRNVRLRKLQLMMRRMVCACASFSWRLVGRCAHAPGSAED